MSEQTELIQIISILPFVLMLGAIAVLPMIAHRFWEENKNKLIVSLILGVPVAVWLLILGDNAELTHIIFFDYIPFIILLGALFVITGGIYFKGDIKCNPKANAIMLIIGGVLASFMGTTGASMLLIRPFLIANQKRKFRVHSILFFIAVIANCGGMLTPLGDPPLFMMYLRGAPFEWFFNLFPEWLFVNGLIVVVYYFVDSFYWKKESDEAKVQPNSGKKGISIQGKLNLVFMLGVVAAVAFINGNEFEFIRNNHNWAFLREGVLLLMTALSLIFTTKKVRKLNQFNWEPIEEVAYLFIGIFITMVPALMYLEANASNFGLNSPGLFYYATGTLSGFLDNTPTAVTFYSVAEGLVKQNPGLLVNTEIVAGIPAEFMRAICSASVFFGAMTYIGNGPNFMVKAIAESNDIKMPSFFAYMIKFAIIVLLPIFILAQLIFV